MGERGWGGCEEDDVRKRRQRMSGCQEEEGEEGEEEDARSKGEGGVDRRDHRGDRSVEWIKNSVKLALPPYNHPERPANQIARPLTGLARGVTAASDGARERAGQRRGTGRSFVVCGPRRAASTRDERGRA